MKHLPFVVLCLMSVPVSRALAGDTLCDVVETTVFACRTAEKPGARIAALCADESRSPWRLTYRFGMPGHVELTYPKQGEAAGFRHATIMYAGKGGDAVLFTRGAYTYALFYVLGHEVDFDGVAVRKGEAEVTNLSCAKGSVDELTTAFFKVAALPAEPGFFEVPEVYFRRNER